MPTLNPSRLGAWALVVGGSSGIGLAHAHLLAERGFNVALVARGRDRLASAAQSLREAHGVEVDVFSADLSKPDAPARILTWLGDRDVGVYASTAGEGSPGDFVDGDLASYLQCVNVKIASTLALTHALARRMRERGAGAILLVSSTGALQGVPSLASNSGAEAYVLAFAEALHHELKPHGVIVSSLMPGPTMTNGARRMIPEGSPMPRGTMTAEATAAAGIRALERGAASRIAGAHNRLLLSALPRGARTRLMGRMISSFFTNPRPRPTDAEVAA